VSGAGAVPYYTDWPTVDLLGLNDVEIAHAPLAGRSVVAHERWASLELLRDRRVELLDVTNRFVHPSADDKRLRHVRRYPELPLKQVPVRGRFLKFATLLPDDELERRLAPLEVTTIP